jgi:2-polyprenyl-3-methyl-5-hydroxy-6-metoxy-1,4-benzoquinol methylase
VDVEWTWDETLFGGSARYYRAGRFPYPAELATAFQEELGLDGRGRLLDVGTGTGEIALLLARLYDEVVGLDADADMIQEARREARRGSLSSSGTYARFCAAPPRPGASARSRRRSS